MQQMDSQTQGVMSVTAECKNSMVSVHVGTGLCVHTCVSGFVCLYVHARVCGFMGVYLRNIVNVCVFSVCVCACACLYSCTYVCSHACGCACVRSGRVLMHVQVNLQFQSGKSNREQVSI